MSLAPWAAFSQLTEAIGEIGAHIVERPAFQSGCFVEVCLGFRHCALDLSRDEVQCEEELSEISSDALSSEQR